MDLIPLFLRLFCVLNILTIVHLKKSVHIKTQPAPRQFDVKKFNCEYHGHCDRSNFQKVPKLYNIYIEVVHLEYNHIETIHKPIFKKPILVQHLILSNNLIEYIEKDSFKDLTTLKRIDLHMNQLKEFHQKLPPLLSLDLSYNPLKDFHVADSKVTYLNLERTNLSHIPLIQKPHSVSHLRLTSPNIDKFLTEDIVPYCQLATFNLLIPENMVPDKCSCARFRHFIGSKRGVEYRQLYNNLDEHPLDRMCPKSVLCKHGKTEYSKKTIRHIEHCTREAKKEHVSVNIKSIVVKLRALQLLFHKKDKSTFHDSI